MAKKKTGQKEAKKAQKDSPSDLHVKEYEINQRLTSLMNDIQQKQEEIVRLNNDLVEMKVLKEDKKKVEKMRKEKDALGSIPVLSLECPELGLVFKVQPYIQPDHFYGGDGIPYFDFYLEDIKSANQPNSNRMNRFLQAIRDYCFEDMQNAIDQNYDTSYFPKGKSGYQSGYDWVMSHPKMKEYVKRRNQLEKDILSMGAKYPHIFDPCGLSFNLTNKY